MGNLLDDLSRLAAAAGTPRGQAIAVLVGLGLLGLALLVLMLTRWGQVKPLSKCIVLSVMAHLLLMAGAHCVRTFAEVPLPLGEEVVNVILIAAEEDPPESQRAPREPQPWEDLSTEQPETAADAPPRTSPEQQAAPQRTAEPAQSLGQPDFPEVPIPPAELPPPPPEIAAETPAELPAPAEPLPEIPAAPDPPAALPPAAMPMAEQLPRLAEEPADRADEADPADGTPAELPSELLTASEPMQRLADVNSLVPLVEALPEQEDYLQRSENRPAEPGASAEETGSDRRVPLKPIPMAAIPPAVLSPPLREASLPRVRETDLLPAPFRGRREENRVQILARNGGTADTEAAVQAALAWLAANQESDGRWDASRHGSGQETMVLGHDRGGAGADADTGISGLALLAFLGNGHTHLEGQYRETIQRGLGFLLCSQATDGNMAGQARLFARMYCHGMAALAVSEAYAMTGDPRLRPYVERAIGYTVRAQNSADGGWRYQPGDAGDTSQFGWQLMALRSAELGGVPVPPATHAGMRRFLHSIRGGRFGGLASYRPHGAMTASMTAEALACRLFLHTPPDDPGIREAVDLLLQESPAKGPINLYYWYYGTIALFQLGGPAWETWNAQLQARLLSAQETVGPHAGSYPTNTVWGSYGGRVYTTAMAALCLEVYYRYLPVLSDAPP